MGGHDVPADVVRRRYAAGLRNFFGLYRPLASTWQVFDNGEVEEPRLIAFGDEQAMHEVEEGLWRSIVQQWGSNS